MLRSFAVRGVVEGFYGEPWSHDARADVMSFLAGRGMNAYAYAPKDDTRHRTEWRSPYDRADLARFGELAAHGSALGVRFGFAISPGLDVDYESEPDRAALLRKLEPLRESGVSWFLLLLDDIPMQPGLAPRQAALATWLYSALGGADLTLCPTEYVGTRPSPYLSELNAGMPAAVDVMWTGPTVCSPQLTADDARGWTKALGGRRVIVWDNYPVNDALMTGSLHLGAYQGRDPDLVDVVGGVLCNPMTQAYASQVALGTAMDFLAGPDGYDAGDSWSSVIADVGGDRREPLRVLARACADSPIAEPATLDLAVAVEQLERELTGPDWSVAVTAIRDELRAARSLTEAFPPPSGPAPATDRLGAEVAPWAAAARRAADAGLAALRLVQASRPVAGLGDSGNGRAAAPDPEPAMHAAFTVLYLWKGARADERVVFGPRFAIYTPVIQMPDGSPALDARAALREDQNSIDALCRLALRAYDTWRTTAADAPLAVCIDGAAQALATDGAFTGPTGEIRAREIMVTQGPASTRVRIGVALPFSDRRLA